MRVHTHLFHSSTIALAIVLLSSGADAARIPFTRTYQLDLTQTVEAGCANVHLDTGNLNVNVACVNYASTAVRNDSVARGTITGIIDTEALVVDELAVSGLSSAEFAVSSDSPNLGPGQETRTIDPFGFDPPLDVTVSFDELTVSTETQTAVTARSIPGQIPIDGHDLTATVALLEANFSVVTELTVDGNVISPERESRTTTLFADFNFSQVPGPGLGSIGISSLAGRFERIGPSADKVADQLGLPFFPDDLFDDAIAFENAAVCGESNIDFCGAFGKGSGHFSSNVVVPEPTTGGLVLAGLVALALDRRRT